MGSLEPSFAQLRATYAHEHYVDKLGKFKSDDPKRQARLAYANLRENRSARRDLAALHAARSHFYGEREFGYKSWYTDKTGVARRLKTQAHRRQFRMGLKSDFEFFNQLRIGDLRTALSEGNPAILQNLPACTKGSVAEFREFFALTPAVDVLKLFVPHKADAIVRILNGIEALADFNQRLGRHLASQPALEPIHAVLCDMLRSGADFTTGAGKTPLSIAAQAVQHICTTPDDDAYNLKKGGTQGDRRSNAGRSGRASGARGGDRQSNHCYGFQRSLCDKKNCFYRHICARCGSSDHGESRCPERRDT